MSVTVVIADHCGATGQPDFRRSSSSSPGSAMLSTMTNRGSELDIPKAKYAGSGTPAGG